ncbi:MAG: SGNH/GDSL hydrolase family protein [Phenylobacterium sp.]|nr:MAG: SGNH/GDSL hydrolase family protein [Phenylobacterium sp.]
MAAAPAAYGAPVRVPMSVWVGSWASAQQIPEPGNLLPADAAHDVTLRQAVRLSLGGRRVRVRLSNAFGTAPLRIDAVHLARGAAGAARIDPASDRALTFDGRPEVSIPAGADYLSDPVDLPVAALTTLTISMHLADAPARQTGHPGSRATSYLASGNQVAAADLTAVRKAWHWWQLAGVEVERPGGAAIVTLGDSITDGAGATTDGDNRWPDVLAARLQADPKTRGLGVLNAGIGGNRVLLDDVGPNALARFDRDVLSPAGVRYLIVLEGINDLGTLARTQPVSPQAHADLTARMIGAYRQIALRARSHGIKVIGATILPDGGSGYYHPDALSEHDRQVLNAWIRAPGHFDAVVDFDAVTRDPADPRRIAARYDSGDGLHPSPAGYKAMAEAIPLALFK